MTFRAIPLFSAVLLALLAVPAPLSAQFETPDITIRDKSSKALAVSLAGLRADPSREAQTFLKVLRADLDRSGWLRVVDNPNARVRVDGSATGAAGLAVSLRITPPNGTTSGWQRSGSSAGTRALAHAAADEILLRLTGHKGMASAPILLVGKRGNLTDIYRCDSDGANLRNLTSEGKLCLSPRWLPGQSGFLYTSFTKGFGGVYRVDFSPNGSLRRTPFAVHPGLNNGAVASPDGKVAALVLSFSGNVELYVQNMRSGALSRLTRTPHANEASPDWSADGSMIAYVSDVGRSPQIHVLRPREKQGRKFIHNLQESVAPDWAPDGRLAFCGKPRGGRYGIYVASASGAYTRVSPEDGAVWEDPSWAPDSRHIVATRTAGGRRELVVLDSETNTWVKLTPADGEWYLADWAK